MSIDEAAAKAGAQADLREDLTAGFGVDDQLCFAAYSASRALVSAYRRRLTPLGLTYTQYLVLLVLWQRPESSMQDICRALDLDSGTLTPVLKRMDEAGLVQRRRGTDDERTVVVTLTETGGDLLPEARRAASEVERLTGMGREDVVHLREELRELTAALDERS